MSIQSQFELEKLREIGRIVRSALTKMATAARPGVTTAELDEIGARALAENGAQPAPPGIYGFPGSVCLSVNEEAIHGIPGDRVLESGDLLKLGLVAEKEGFFADAAITIGIGDVSETARALITCHESAFRESLKAAWRPIGYTRSGETSSARSGAAVFR